MGSQINSDSPTISLPQGKLVGVKLHDSLPEPVDGWLGVPYAQPPIGDLRFRLPVKLSPSPDTVIDASKYGPAGPGKALLPGPPLEKSEDCLTVNVFRKSAGKHEKLPVALYIHGGAFNRGSAHMHKTASMVANAPESFIAISFNYRIGALGFLPSSLSAKEGALNLGLRDQILMMEWVQENIEAFGGDPNNVTLFGLSAGAHSVSLGTSLASLCTNIKKDRSPYYALQGRSRTTLSQSYHRVWRSHITSSKAIRCAHP